MYSVQCKDCGGCKHQQNGPGWCYIFEDKPEHIPCSQHDKHRAEREITSKILQTHPCLFIAFIQEAASSK